MFQQSPPVLSSLITQDPDQFFEQEPVPRTFVRFAGAEVFGCGLAALQFVEFDIAVTSRLPEHVGQHDDLAGRSEYGKIMDPEAVSGEKFARFPAERQKDRAVILHGAKPPYSCFRHR